MNLNGQAIIKHVWVSDPNTGLTTITFQDVLSNPLGTFVIETPRLRTFINAMAEISKDLWPDALPGQTPTRTKFDGTNGETWFN